MDSTTRKGTNYKFTPRLYKVTIVKWISFMAFDGKHFFPIQCANEKMLSSDHGIQLLVTNIKVYFRC